MFCRASLASLSISASILVGCGTEYVDTRTVPTYQDPQFLELIESFDNHYGTQVLGNMGVAFGDTYDKEKPNAVGWCYYMTNGRYVVINEDYWNRADDNQREVLIFHELGHCALSRGHTEETMEYVNREVPISIMYPSVIGGQWYYEPLRDHYLDELRQDQLKLMGVTDELSKIQ